jgi:hypothetical protein
MCGLITQNSVLDIHHGDQTHVGQWLHSFVAYGYVQGQKNITVEVTEISLSGYHRGDEEGHNNSNGGPHRITSSSCDD